MRKARILIIDDELDICILLAEALASDKWTVEWSNKPLEALEMIRAETYELVLLDIKMPEISGLELLPQIKIASPETAVMIMSAYGNITLAVQAMKEGAEDYMEKPFQDLEEVQLTAERLVEVAMMRMENRFLRQQLEEKFTLDGLISASPLMQEVFSLVKRIAPISTSVLINGETGTGKELIAHAIHQYSKRANGPFISVNCGGLPENLLESLLFGHEKGAFTGAVRRTRGYFEEANEGTLFLDEIGDTPLALQVKLLRTLQDRTIQRVGGKDVIPVDIRLIAATNRNLEKEIKDGNFRNDLYFRLNVIAVNLPALRDRKEDIPLLVRYFIDKYCQAFDRPTCDITKDGINYLCSQEWPGNVRQLENIIERAIALSDGKPITLHDLSDDASGRMVIDWMTEILNMPIKYARREFEKRYLLENLHRHNGSVTKASKTACIPRQNYHRKMKQLGIPPTRRLYSEA